MKKNDKLVVGDVLFILPISGVEHTVTKGQTLKSIAKLYKADVSDIAFYNGIAPDAALAVGEVIVVPDGELAPVQLVQQRVRGAGGPSYDGYYLRPIIDKETLTLWFAETNYVSGDYYGDCDDVFRHGEDRIKRVIGRMDCDHPDHACDVVTPEPYEKVRRPRFTGGRSEYFSDKTYIPKGKDMY